MDNDQSKSAQVKVESNFRCESDRELAQSAAALLDELASSLEASQTAVLASDLKTLEQATREQARIQRALQILWTPPADSSHAAGQLSASHLTSALKQPSLRQLPFSQQLHSAEQRVLYLGRVLAALLARRQRWLRTLAHLAAGPGAIYSPPSRPAAAGQEYPPCQA